MVTQGLEVQIAAPAVATKGERIAARTTVVARDHLLFFDLMRNVAMLAVILFHSVAAYSTMTPYWDVHDGTSILADFARQVFDVFMMPVFFFVAGFFALVSLRKKDPRSFLASKLARIGIPWLLWILVVLPLLGYKGHLAHPVGGVVLTFGEYWLRYAASVGTFRMQPLALGQTTQGHFWYLSLLLAFFVGFVLLYRLFHGGQARSVAQVATEPASARSVLQALALFGLLTTAVYYLAVLLVPDMSWVTIDLLLQFQPTKVGLYALYFGLGVFACSRRWFAGQVFPGRPAAWALACAMLVTGFLATGQDVFAHQADSHLLSPVLLLAFALARSFLCLAVLVMLTSFALRFANRPLPINQALAAHSYNIYLVHLIFLIGLQNVLAEIGSGAVLAKIGIVTVLTIVLSYGTSRLINRFPRGFVGVLLGVFALMAIVAR